MQGAWPWAVPITIAFSSILVLWLCGWESQLVAGFDYICSPGSQALKGFIFRPSSEARHGGIDFDPTEQGIRSIHKLLYGRQVSCRQVVQAYLVRIETLNPQLNAIIALNNLSLTIADSLDAVLLSEGTVDAPLFCIPVLLKDNFDTAGMATTAGSISLEYSQPEYDAPVVTRLKHAGAIILGKSNMHEFALEGLSVSSLGGQTHNPYDLTRTPGGSSGGSGAAVAVSLSTFATGSDTVNSIRSPAASNSLCGIRPTRGLISRSGIIPVSHTQDTIGPLSRTIEDLALAFEVMVGRPLYDSDDIMSAAGVDKRPDIPYAQSLTGTALQGARIGVLTTMFNYTDSNETTPVNLAMQETLDTFAAAGASLIQIPHSLFNSTLLLAEYDVQDYEFASGLTKYLHGRNNIYDSFDAIYDSQKFLPLCYQEVLGRAAKMNRTTSEYARRIEKHAELRTLLLTEFDQNGLDAVLYPEQRNLVVPIGSLSQEGRNGILAAILGYPVVVVPIGFSLPTRTAPIGLPIGMEILGKPFTEAKLLDLAYSYEMINKARRPPVLAQTFISSSHLAQVPMIRSNRSVHPKYLQIPAGFP